jgi:hypoxanthine phosphoribosyltransferase
MADPGLELLFDADAIAERVAALGRRIADDHPDGAGEAPLLLVGVLKGAAIFLADLARAIERPVDLDFVAASSYGAGRASSGTVRLLAETRVGGRRVVLVEDVVDTGRTLAALHARLGEQGPRSLRTAALLDKPARREVTVAVDYVGFTAPDRFLVGYGLDLAGRYRNLGAVYALPSA